MPWRETSDPYAIWVSEVMLQQTRVDTVRPYYERWMARFPTVGKLADAELDDVLREWQGLGYYSRARNLHRAARLVRERHGGTVPDNTGALRSLPGVGEYTAGAIASIAFGMASPAVDGNVRRVLARCGPCPLSEWCLAYVRGTQAERPRSRPGKPVPEASVATVVMRRDGDQVLLVRRPVEGLLGGLWEFPDPDVPGIAALVATSRRVAALAPVVHRFSHLTVTYRPTLYALDVAPVVTRESTAAGPDRVWVPLADPGGYAMPVAQHKIAALARAFLSGA
jgi:A/G-specific adenine glycosylase